MKAVADNEKKAGKEGEAKEGEAKEGVAEGTDGTHQDPAKVMPSPEAGAGAPAGATASPQKRKRETKAQRRARLAAEARKRRPKFDPHNYPRKLKYGGTLPGFAEMT